MDQSLWLGLGVLSHFNRLEVFVELYREDKYAEIMNKILVDYSLGNYIGYMFLRLVESSI